MAVPVRVGMKTSARRPGKYKGSGIRNDGFCYEIYLKMNISSIGSPTALEISIANLREGLYCAFSKRIIVSRRTPTCAANCSCVKFFNCLYFFSLHSKSGTLIPRFRQMVRHGRNDTAKTRKEMFQELWRER